MITHDHAKETIKLLFAAPCQVALIADTVAQPLESKDFTADDAANKLVAVNTLATTCRIRFTTTGTLPSPLQLAKDYWVINPTDAHFQVSLDPASVTPIDIANIGTGTHTFIEQEPNMASDLDVWIRREVNYQGSERQEISFLGKESRFDYQNSLVFLDPSAYTFYPIDGDVTFRWEILIANGLTLPGDLTGNIKYYYDYVTPQTITAGSAYSKTITPSIILA